MSNLAHPRISLLPEDKPTRSLHTCYWYLSGVESVAGLDGGDYCRCLLRWFRCRTRWHGLFANDNASGVAMMLEMARLQKNLLQA
jgi:hypothetical protein